MAGTDRHRWTGRRRWRWIVAGVAGAAVAAGASASHLRIPAAWFYSEFTLRNPPVENRRFSHSDCMVKAIIRYPGGSDEDIQLTLADRIWRAVYLHAVDRGLPLVAANIGDESISLTAMYFLFSQRCEEKQAMAAALAEATVAALQGRIGLTVTQDVVRPGYETLHVDGPYWTDGPEGQPLEDCCIMRLESGETLYSWDSYGDPPVAISRRYILGPGQAVRFHRRGSDGAD